MTDEKPRIRERNIAWGKVVAVALILFLAASDFYSMYSLFQSLDYGDMEKIIFSLTMACFLEGLPFYMGVAVSKRFEENKYERTSPKVETVAAIASFITYVLAAALAVGLRWLWIEENGGLSAFMSDRYGGMSIYNNTFIGEVFKLCAPILTSILAFIASWLAFRGGNPEKLGKITRGHRTRYYDAEKDFQITYQRNKAARTSLWAAITDPDTDPMPGTFEVFRQQCFIKIREKLLDNCMTTYPTQIERFSTQVESVLAEYILEISGHSTLPQSISKITIQEMLKSYDEQIGDPADAWNVNKSGPLMADELKRSLENAVIVAQYTTTLQKK